MAKIIRVDADVWRWLQAQASPLEDTPNTVLRRVAGLDKKQTQRKEHSVKVAKSIVDAVPSIDRTESGKRLNAKYKLGAKHALYHVDGTFYEQLHRFPGVLCDGRGYVWYECEEDFLSDSELQIGQKVNVKSAISNHPDYQLFVGSQE